VDLHELKVAMRTLCFDFKKAKVFQTLHDHDNMGHGLHKYDDFVKISCVLRPSIPPSPLPLLYVYGNFRGGCNG
jgi:hypothetical protein